MEEILRLLSQNKTCPFQNLRALLAYPLLYGVLYAVPAPWKIPPLSLDIVRVAYLRIREALRRTFMVL